jgi:hypothetical protein
MGELPVCNFGPVNPESEGKWVWRGEIRLGGEVSPKGSPAIYNGVYAKSGDAGVF